VLGENSQVILLGRLHRAQPHRDQTKLDETKALVIIWMPGGHDLEDKAIHSTYSLTHNLIWEFQKENTHRSKSKARSGTWVA
jgi:hypothetical protein